MREATGSIRGSQLLKLTAPFRSSTFLSAAAFALGGVGFALGNLLLARLLPAAEYGAVALILALTQIGITVGPLGAPISINRHHLTASARLLQNVTATSLLAGIAISAVACFVYGLQASLGIVLAVTITAAGVNRVASAFFQSRQDFRLSLFLLLIHNWIVLCAVPVVLLMRNPTAMAAALVTTAGYLAMAAIGWRRAFQHTSGVHAVSVPAKTLIQEGLAAVGFQLAVALMFQLDRLLIPRTLSLADLATFSVVSALAGSPARMLQVGVGYALLPRLRVSTTRAGALRLIVREGAGTFFIMAVASVAVLVATPWIMHHFLGDRYPYIPSLLIAIVAVGFVRVCQSFAGTVVSALGSARQLLFLNVSSWFGVAVGMACAIWASRFGLTGVIYGIGVGWGLMAVTATVIAWRALVFWPRVDRDALTVTSPE